MPIVTIQITLTEEELEAFRKEMLICASGSTSINGVDITNIYKQMKKQIVKICKDNG